MAEKDFPSPEFVVRTSEMKAEFNTKSKDCPCFKGYGCNHPSYPDDKLRYTCAFQCCPELF